MLLETSFDSDRWKYIEASQTLRFYIQPQQALYAEDRVVMAQKLLDCLQKRIAAGKAINCIYAETMTAAQFETDWPGVLALRSPDSWKPLFVKLKSW